MSESITTKSAALSVLKTFAFLSLGFAIALLFFYTGLYPSVNNCSTQQGGDHFGKSVLLKNGMLLPDLHSLMGSEDVVRIFEAGRVNDKYEVVYILKLKAQQQGADEPQYLFTAFGKEHNLTFKPWNFKTGNCHFQSVKGLMSVTISHCSQEEIMGLLMDDNGNTFDIKPLSPHLREILAPPVVEGDEYESVGAHVVRAIKLGEFLKKVAATYAIPFVSKQKLK